MADGAQMAGWYVIVRNSDDAISCLHRDERGWWQLIGRNTSRLPAGWRTGPRVDDLLDLWFAAPHTDIDPRDVAP